MNSVCRVLSAIVVSGLLPVAAACHAQDTDSAAASAFRVMSFNIRYGTANDGQDAWPLRRDLVVETIKASNPDLLGTQETLRLQADFLQAQLPNYQYVGWSREERPDGEQCGILFRRERFDLLESGQFWLSESPETKFSKSWDSSLPRVVTWVRLQDKSSQFADGSRAFLFVNTHFDHRGTTARLESARLLRKWTESQPDDLPIVITGDFNCDQGSAPWKTLTESSRLVDVFRAVHPQPLDSEGTFHGFTGTAGTGRIDWVLCSPSFQAVNCQINRSSRDGRFPSDHFAIDAVIRAGD